MWRTHMRQSHPYTFINISFIRCGVGWWVGARCLLKSHVKVIRMRAPINSSYFIYLLFIINSVNYLLLLLCRIAASVRRINEANVSFIFMASYKYILYIYMCTVRMYPLILSQCWAVFIFALVWHSIWFSYNVEKKYF